MPRYGYYPKGKWNGEVITSTVADTPVQAIDYFAKMKQLPRKEFLKLFIVTEIK